MHGKYKRCHYKGIQVYTYGRVHPKSLAIITKAKLDKQLITKYFRTSIFNNENYKFILYFVYYLIIYK